MLSLIKAARVSGQSKSTIWRAVNSGLLSATRTYTGDYQIDPAELHRIFSLGTSEGRATTVSVKRDAIAMERAVGEPRGARERRRRDHRLRERAVRRQGTTHNR